MRFYITMLKFAVIVLKRNLIQKIINKYRRGMVSEVPWKEPDNSNVNYIK